MITKLSIEQANPFIEMDNITSTINDLRYVRTQVEYKSVNGLVVSLPNDESCLLQNIIAEDINNFNIGDSVDIYLDQEGNAYKNAGKYEIYSDVISKARDGYIFNAQIIDAVIDVKTPGLIVTIDKLQCFMPKGQIGYNIEENLDTYIGSTITAKLISIKLKEKEGNRFLPIVSHKILIDEKTEVEAQDKFNDLKVGDIISGTVKSIVDYGVFVNLFPKVDGLILLKDLSWDKVKDASQIVSLGQDISVVILDIQQQNDGKRRISLGLKQLIQKPWEHFDKSAKVGDIVFGTICNIADYGLFIMLPSKVQGLIHRTELSWDDNITTRDFQEGQVISAKILKIDWENEKLLLSLKQMIADPWTKIEEKYHIGDIVDVTITKLTNFGIFVKLEDGIIGMIHVSELSWVEKNKKPKEYYQLNEVLKVIIISIDKEHKRIELSYKRLIPNPWQKYTINQKIRTVFVDRTAAGIQVKIIEDDLPAFIPADNIPENFNLEKSYEFDCEIKEVDENRGIILAIV